MCGFVLGNVRAVVQPVSQQCHVLCLCCCNQLEVIRNTLHWFFPRTLCFFNSWYQIFCRYLEPSQNRSTSWSTALPHSDFCVISSKFLLLVVSIIKKVESFLPGLERVLSDLHSYIWEEMSTTSESIWALCLMAVLHQDTCCDVKHASVWSLFPSFQWVYWSAFSNGSISGSSSPRRLYSCCWATLMASGPSKSSYPVEGN